MGTAYRYWRVRIEGTAVSTVYVTLIEMRTASDGSGANLTITGNGSASASAGSNPELAFDGIDGGTSNAWQVFFSTTGYWIKWDFGAGVAYDLKHFGIKMTNATSGITLFFEGSNDNSTWEVRAVFPSPPNAAMGYVRANQPLSAVVPPSPAKKISGKDRSAAAARISGASARVDQEDGGQYRIVSTVEVKGTPNVPVHRRVVLINERSRRVVRETWSDPVTGEYRFEGIRGDVTYTTMAYDYTNNKRAAVADNLTAERMP